MSCDVIDMMRLHPLNIPGPLLCGSPPHVFHDPPHPIITSISWPTPALPCMTHPYMTHPTLSWCNPTTPSWTTPPHPCLTYPYMTHPTHVLHTPPLYDPTQHNTPTPPLHDPPHPQITLYKDSYHNNWHQAAFGSGRSNIYYLTHPTPPNLTPPHPCMTHLPTPAWPTPPHPWNSFGHKWVISWGPSLCLPFGR